MNGKIIPVLIGIFAIVLVISIGYFVTIDIQKMESKTVQSITEVHIDRDNHQFVIILPSDNKIYDGKITWVASQPILPAVLHGPLDTTEINGQFSASIDEGKTIHAITVVSPQLLNGTYSFVGNGLVMHNADNNSFWISYSVSYKEVKNGDN